MGVDFLDIKFRVERELGVKLRREVLSEILKERTPDLSAGGWADMQVREFVLWVEKSISEQNLPVHKDVFESVKQQIAECLAVEESEVTLDAWIVKDLGME